MKWTNDLDLRYMGRPAPAVLKHAKYAPIHRFHSWLPIRWPWLRRFKKVM